MELNQAPTVEERLHKLETLICDVAKTVISVVDRVSGVEAALVSVRKDEQLYETLSELAADVRKLLPKLQNSIEYVEAFRETQPVPVAETTQQRNFVNVQENKHPGFGLLGPAPNIWAPTQTMSWVTATANGMGTNGLHQNSSRALLSNGKKSVSSVFPGADKQKQTDIKPEKPGSSQHNGGNGIQKCAKMCSKNLHPCGHEISSANGPGPCPPCIKTVNKKYSCGHAFDTPCFGLDKVRCSICIKINGIQQSPVMTDEEIVKAIRRKVNDVSLKNTNACKITIAELMMTYKNNVEAIASIFCQKTLQESNEAPDPNGVATYFAKIVSEVCKLVKNDSAHQFKSETKEFMLQVFESILKLKKDQENYIAMTINNKLPKLDEDSRRDLVFNMISQLYLFGIFTLGELKDRVLQPVFGNIKLLQRAAELVLMCSARIKTDIENTSDKGKAKDLKLWFENFISYLADSSMQVPKDEREKLTACMEILNTTWKPSGTKTPLPILKKDELADEISFESIDMDAKRQRLLSGSSSGTSGSTSPKYSVPISETRDFFAKYLALSGSKKKIRAEFLKKYFLDKDESFMGAFVRTLSHNVLELTNKSQVESMGVLLCVMIESGIVPKDRVVKSFAEGVMWNFCKPDIDQAKLEADISSVAIVLVNGFTSCYTDLNWIDAVGLPLQNNFVSTWKLFCKQVLKLLRWRFPTENRVVVFFNNSTSPTKEKLKVELDNICKMDKEK